MKDIDLPALAREIITRHSDQFNGLFGPTAKSRKIIRRVFTRADMREIVRTCLIVEYRIPQIIDAVTDYLFELANADRHMDLN